MCKFVQTELLIVILFVHQLSNETSVGDVTFVVHFKVRFGPCLLLLQLIPVQPDHQHLMQHTDSSDHHEQQGALHWVRVQGEAEDLHEVRETQRGEEESGDERPHGLNPAAGEGHTGGLKPPGQAPRWKFNG